MRQMAWNSVGGGRTPPLPRGPQRPQSLTRWRGRGVGGRAEGLLPALTILTDFEIEVMLLMLSCVLLPAKTEGDLQEEGNGN